MSPDEPRQAAPLPSNQRKVFLDVLRQVINEAHPTLRAEPVTRAGCLVLFVLNAEDSRRQADVGCDFDRRRGWSFTWAAEGSPIAAARDPHGAAARIARTLH